LCVVTITDTCLGVLTADPVADALGTGFQSFVSPCGVHGLAKVTGRRLDVLAVAAVEEGKGYFREFVRQAKREFLTVSFVEVWNDTLAATLDRYGFRPSLAEFSGEQCECWRWDTTEGRP
jgi:hypothetical protein